MTGCAWTPAELLEAIATAPALSMWQPWLHAVLRLDKRIENRVWPTNHRGAVLLHAAKGYGTLQEFTRAANWCKRNGADVWERSGYGAVVPQEYSWKLALRPRDPIAVIDPRNANMLKPDFLGEPLQPRGGFLAVARVVGCVLPRMFGWLRADMNTAYWKNQEQRWYMDGQYAWLLEDVMELPLVAANGRQRLFRPGEADRQRLREAWLTEAR